MESQELPSATPVADNNDSTIETVLGSTQLSTDKGVPQSFFTADSSVLEPANRVSVPENLVNRGSVSYDANNQLPDSNHADLLEERSYRKITDSIVWDVSEPNLAPISLSDYEQMYHHREGGWPDHNSNNGQDSDSDNGAGSGDEGSLHRSSDEENDRTSEVSGDEQYSTMEDHGVQDDSADGSSQDVVGGVDEPED
ncbi:hypothetical protein IFR05_009113 [Cadophora sp. M221]|nr:hypothetical protein IFR05_009113 [Cadophora sp. M221]